MPALGGDEVGDLLGAAADDLGGAIAGSGSGRSASASARSPARSRRRGECRRPSPSARCRRARRCRDCGRRSTRSPPTCSPAMRIFSRSTCAVPHVLQLGHHVHARRPRHCRWLSARSKASKLRQRRPGRQRVRVPVGDQRHLLLGDAAVRAQRRVEARQVVAVAAGADHGQALGDDDEVADAIGRQLEARAGLGARQHELDAGHGRDARARRPRRRPAATDRPWRTSPARRGGRRRDR